MLKYKSSLPEGASGRFRCLLRGLNVAVKNRDSNGSAYHPCDKKKVIRWTPVHPNDPHTSPRSCPKSGPRFPFSALGLVIAFNVILPDFLEGCLSAAGRCVLWPPAGVYPLTPRARGPVGGAWRSAASTAALSLRPRALARNLPRGANGISRSQKASSATPCAGRDLGAPRPSAERPLAFRLRLTALQWLVTSGTRDSTETAQRLLWPSSRVHGVEIRNTGNTGPRYTI
ncbi:uncharacterized protein LOC142567151 [Dermacentor variabilis]|uniref:uncharacterized protein LOC142567151 n=1 Tax=Dermacentor variabilis TaxID=34621 RepID=UPI003F5BAFA5